MLRRSWILCLALLLLLTACGVKTQTPPATPFAQPGSSQSSQSTQSGQSATTTAGGQPVKIGIHLGITGPYAALAEDAQRGYNLAAEQINAKGGLQGRKVELVFRDDKMDPGEASKLAQELIQNEKAQFLMGCLSAATALAVNEQAKKANLPYIATCQSNNLNKAPDFGPLTFHEALTPYLNGNALADWAVKNLGKRVFFLMPDYALGKEYYEVLPKAVKAAGGEEVGVIWYPFGTADFSTYVSQLKAAKPDVVVTPAIGKDQTNMLKQFKAFGLDKQFKTFLLLADLQTDIQNGFQYTEGTYGGASFYWELAEKEPAAKAFVDAYQQKYNLPPSGYAAYAYSGLQVLAAAVAKAGDIEPKQVAAALAGMEYNTHKGNQVLRACDHQSLQPILIVKGRSASEAEKLGKAKYGFREIISVIPASENLERTCQELGVGK